MERRIRDCYSEAINFSSYDLIKMMVLDGLFIIELFARVGVVVQSDPDEPLFNMVWIFPSLMRDLLRLENQIPFFVLQTLFENSKITRTRGDQSLATLILRFFNYTVQRPLEVLENYNNLEGKHLLDFFRLSFIPQTRRPSPKKKGKQIVPLLQLIQSAKKLHVAGIKFKTREADSFLDIIFQKGVLKIPQITIDAFTTSFFLNSVAFEQCYSHCSKHMTAYTTFMGCLINTPSDAGYLCDQNIMENYLGPDEEVSHLFDNLGKEVAFDIEINYLSNVFEEVNGYYSNDWHAQWAGIRHTYWRTYFNTPWSFISALAAVILLLLTMIQTFFAVYSYAHPPKP